MAGPYNYSGSGGILSGGSTGFMPSLVSSAAKTGLSFATGGVSDIVGGVLNLIPTIFQGITGRKQLKEAAQIERENPRPTATIAPSVQEAVDRAYGKTLSTDIPGGELYRDEIKGATAAGINAASQLGSGSEAYGMLGQLVGREQNSFADLAKTTAQQVAGYEDNYMNALGQKANEENRVWNWNQADPYLNAAATARALRDSGLRNINSGVKNLFGTAAEYTNKTPDLNSSLAFGNSTGNTGAPDASAVAKIIQGLLGK